VGERHLERVEREVDVGAVLVAAGVRLRWTSFVACWVSDRL
jgi:hypothetical protein